MSCPLTLAIGMRSSGRACRQARRTRVSAKAAAWIQHTSCTHPIAGCRERSRIVGRQRYPGRRPYQVSARVYQECQAVSWSRAHWCSKTKAMPDRQRQGFFSRVPEKLAKQGFPRLRNYNTFAKSRHFAPHEYCVCNFLRLVGGNCELNGRAGRAIRPGRKRPESNHSQNEQENYEKASSEGHLLIQFDGNEEEPRTKSGC
jgi:hypothetical protein